MNMAIPLMELFCVHVGDCVVSETKQIHNLALMSSVTLAPISMRISLCKRFPLQIVISVLKDGIQSSLS